MSPEDIVNLIPDPVLEWRYRRQLCAEAFERGHAAGYNQGYEQAAKDLERNWRVVADRAKENAKAPTNAELQQRRAAPARHLRALPGGAA